MKDAIGDGHEFPTCLEVNERYAPVAVLQRAEEVARILHFALGKGFLGGLGSSQRVDKDLPGAKTPFGTRGRHCWLVMMDYDTKWTRSAASDG